LEVLIPGYLLRHDLAQALDLLTAWTEREPRNVRALLWLVEVCQRLQLPERAMNAARSAAVAAPDRADVRTKCGLILIEFNQMVEARPHLERARKVRRSKNLSGSARSGKERPGRIDRNHQGGGQRPAQPGPAL